MEGKLKRLVHLAGTDPGFYVLALHAFVEYYLREEEGLRDIESFSDLTWEYRNRLMERAGGAFVDGLNSLSQLGRQHKFTNKVRHSFDELDPEEAVAATHLFTRFCLLVGLGGAAPAGAGKESGRLAGANLRTGAAGDPAAHAGAVAGAAAEERAITVHRAGVRTRASQVEGTGARNSEVQPGAGGT
ncbi:MAG: hypothetical protein ACOCYG_02745 [Spirochaetota bacterium]